MKIEKSKSPYTILPFNFLRFPKGELLLVNVVGEWLFIKSEAFDNLLNNELNLSSQIFTDLKGKHFVTDTAIEPVIDMLAIKYRSKKAFLKNFTALHMMVITARCNFRCKYCHASSEDIEKGRWDMSPATARKVVDIIFQTPSPIIKIEFQGGEPLSNWETIKSTVEYAKNINRRKKKYLEFVLCTNLTMITSDILDFLKEHNILVSTSLDGPKNLHDKQRILRTGDGTYDLFIEKLRIAKSILGINQIGALMTTTKNSLPHFRDIINEYLSQQFQGVFFRPLNPFGFAKTDSNELGYDVDNFIKAYKDALCYIIDLNIRGTFFVEQYATILLSRILTPFATRFMDLQFPAGVGICGAIYDYNGNVYPSDEARMLAKMGDYKFLLGNVNKDSYLNIFDNPLLHKIIEKSCAEILPGCSSCAFQMYCGSDPIRNYSEQGDIIGYRSTSDLCKINTEIITLLFNFLRTADDNVLDVFWSWITKRSIGKIRGEELPRFC